tara:strand:+ start:1167 stop:1523 length:357 start_codon:yes stop_codon:yes gene_type:complete
MNIPIKCKSKEYFGIYLQLLNPVLKLKDREIEVLASFMLLLYNNRSMNTNKATELIFSTKVRKIIRESIGMSEASFNNHITSLRKKKLITGKNINPILLKGFPINNSSNITFKLELDD